MSGSGSAVLDGPLSEQSTTNLPPALDDLEARLRAALSGRVDDLHLEVRGKGLVLSGRAHSFYAKQLAQHAVMDATDLPLVANTIVVA